MKVRGREEPWCTGPGWYRIEPGVDETFVGPFPTQWVALQQTYMNPCIAEIVFEITPADIEAES